jgi:hypothetical protein
MSYTTEQREKNSAYIMQEMADYSHEERGQVIAEANRTWPDDAEIKTLVTNKKAQIAKEATPEEVDEVFKHVRV